MLWCILFACKIIDADFTHASDRWIIRNHCYRQSKIIHFVNQFIPQLIEKPNVLMLLLCIFSFLGRKTDKKVISGFLRCDIINQDHFTRDKWDGWHLIIIFEIVIQSNRTD